MNEPRQRRGSSGSDMLFSWPGWPAGGGERRGWDLNPRWVAPHTISNRADSAALAPLLHQDRLACTSRPLGASPAAGRGSRALRNGAPQTGSGPDGSSPQRAAPCAVGSLAAAPCRRRAAGRRTFERAHGFGGGQWGPGGWRAHLRKAPSTRRRCRKVYPTPGGLPKLAPL
jgi:hypothetical protein